MDDAAGIPEDLRCKRSDGKQWRCSALSMPDKTVCEKHYIQAKKRAANSAMRAGLKKAKRRSLADGAYLNDRHSGGNRRGEKAGKGPNSDAMGARGGSFGRGSIAAGQFEETAGDYSDSSGEAEGLTCHQCRRNDRVRVLWCMNCDRRGYCDSCVARWYVDDSMEDIRRACPACRGICSCAVCRRGESLIKARIREVSSLDKLKYLHSLLSVVLPTLKKIHSEQCFEMDLENKLYGIKSDIPRAKINSDEQMCCDICGIPIVDYHRHCANCSTDLCLDCCREIRRRISKGDTKDRHITDRGRDASSILAKAESSGRVDGINLNIQHLFPRWKAKSDGSIRCPGDHCSSPVTLRRIFKINWVSKLAKNVEEMVNGCRVSDPSISGKCIYCSQRTSTSGSNFYKYSQRQGNDNFLYTPTAFDIRGESISHFRKHWANGEPVIVKHAIDYSLVSSWDPRSIWIGINETTNERLREDDAMIVKAIDFLTRSEVDIELDDFIRGYSERCVRGEGTPKMLKLKEWPSSGDLEEFLLCQRPAVLKELPLLEFIHTKWGLLNLAAKLPHDTMQNDGGPQLYIAYGNEEEVGNGDSVIDLNINISDMVYILVHSAKLDFYTQRQTEYDRVPENDAEYLLRKSPRDGHGHFKEGKESAGDEYIGKGDAGAIWDIFRRQDVPKLNEYLRIQTVQLRDPNISTNQVINPLHDQAYFLHKDQKQKLKEELGIEPWTFKQHIGEAVFIPAGCAFQLRNLKPCVQLTFDFLFPESLSESMRVAQEIRCLSSEHVAKLKMLEVGKMPLYASSWAIQEIQKMILDPKLGAELGFQDCNLTEMVSDNLQRLSKRSQITCK